MGCYMDGSGSVFGPRISVSVESMSWAAGLRFFPLAVHESRASLHIGGPNESFSLAPRFNIPWFTRGFRWHLLRSHDAGRRQPLEWLHAKSLQKYQKGSRKLSLSGHPLPRGGFVEVLGWTRIVQISPWYLSKRTVLRRYYEKDNSLSLSKCLGERSRCKRIKITSLDEYWSVKKSH